MSCSRTNLKPRLFITLTYSFERKDPLDIERDVRAYLLWLCRKTDFHMSRLLGVETGSNSHAHLCVYSPGMEVDDRILKLASTKRAWRFGRLDVQEWDHSKDGESYIRRHNVIDSAGEVYHPRKGKCRRDNCEHPQRLDFDDWCEVSGKTSP
jgi:hypothetical protein